MKPFIYFMILAPFFGGCKKADKEHTVVYKVEVISGHPSYSLSYSSEKNATQTAGPLTDTKWTSPVISDRETGASVSLTLQGGSGGSYKMYLIVDGSLEKEDRMDDPYGPKTISATLKED